MPDSFVSTAERMYDSSKILHRESNYHNAAYLAGYIIECYGKILLSLDSTQSPRGFSHRVTDINSQLQYLLTSSTIISHNRQYIIDMSISCPNILNLWDPKKRYADNITSWDAITSQNFQLELETCWEKIIEMSIDGII